MKSFIAAAVTAALAAIALAAPASACPDWRGRPHFGSIQLNAGFLPDPYVRNITAGGTHNLAACGIGAAGYATTRPDFDLYWNGSSSQLTFAVQASADAILLISGPNGEVWYNDDYYGTNPVVVVRNPPPGLYDIWIGSYDGSRRNPGQLIITELNY